MVSPIILKDFYRKETERRKASASLYEFVKQSWHVVEPGVPFIESWHIEEICEHLEAVSAGEIRKLLINIPPRHALDVNTDIPTPDGFKKIRDLQVGDYVFSPDGKPILVKGKSKVFKGQQVYKVTTDDGAYLDVDSEHLWTVRLDRGYKKYQTFSTEQLYWRQQGYFLRTKRNGEVELNFNRQCKEVRKARLPDQNEVEYPTQDLLIDPYVLGIWLGDGSRNCSSVTKNIEDQKYIRQEIERRGYNTSDNNAYLRFRIDGLITKLKKLGIHDRKKIPEQYLIADTKQRRDLLKGLMDTDGNVSKKGQCCFTQSNLLLILQVQKLIRSLGIKCTLSSWVPKVNGKQYSTAYRLSFFAKDIACIPRKNERANIYKEAFGRYISIEKLDCFADMQCISVDSDDGLFIAGNGYVVTHNSKSTIVSVMFPMWEWQVSPEEKYLCASYSGKLAIRDNLKARRLAQSPWYQERWGHLFKFAGDQNEKSRFENDRTGYRLATSVGGYATGEGGSRLLLDDPHGAQDAQSETMRETTLEWFDQVWSSRLNDPKRDCMITVMQRLHEKDISGHILTDIGGWEHICIPAEYDGKRRTTVLGSYDPREKIGELICPDRFGDKEIDDLKKLLGIYGTAGQLQQDPQPSEGGILKTKYFEMWPADKGLPPFEYILQSYDCAFTEKTSGDPTACTVWAIFTHKGERNAMLIDAWDEHLGYPDLRTRAIKDWGTEYGGISKESPHSRARRPDRVLVEAKASGQSLLQDLRLAKVPAIGYNPGNADKISRAHQATPTLELGILWIPESAKNRGHFVSWAQKFLKQLERFPVAEHDDYVDTFTQAIIYFKNSGFFELPVAKDYDEPPPKIKQRVNPYAV